MLSPRKWLTVLCACGLGAAPVAAATSTSTFDVQLTVTASCAINSTSTLDFGQTSDFNTDLDMTSAIEIQCINGTDYDVGLNGGTTAGGSVAQRLLTDGNATIQYAMYSDSGRTTNWGETIGTDTVHGTGDGTAQSLIVYGRVPTQSGAAPGSYADTVTVTLTY